MRTGQGRGLLTEVYFNDEADERLRATDRVFQGRGPRKGELIAALQDASAQAGRGFEPGALCCEFDLTLGGS